MTKIISEYGFSPISCIEPKNIVAFDSDYYKYKINLSNLKNGKKPDKLKNNPYAIHNIKRFLEINFPSVELLDNEYIGCKHKMRIICKKHQDRGIQFRSASELFNRMRACSFCGYENMGAKRRISPELAMGKCSELGMKYLGQFCDNGETNVEFICPKHIMYGKQVSKWYHFKDSAIGCKYCSGKIVNTKVFKDKIRNINSSVEIIGEYVNYRTPILCKCMICKKEYSITPSCITDKSICPFCNLSAGEKQVSFVLDAIGVKYYTQKTFSDCRRAKKLRFDFYLPEYNTVIEYDGIQHFRPVDFAGRGEKWAENEFKKTKDRDAIKDEYCELNHIRLLRIHYKDFDNIEHIIKEYIYNSTKSQETAGCM